jgi:serine protease Do
MAVAAILTLAAARATLDRRVADLAPGSQNVDVRRDERGNDTTSPPSFADVAAAANPAVVHVSGTRKVVVSLPPEQGLLPDSPEKMPDSGPAANARSVREHVDASGFAIRDDGTIVTSRAAVADAEEVTVRFPSDPTPYKAKVIANDEPTDLAIIKVGNHHGVRTLSFGDAASTRVGDWVLAVGNPYGLSQTVTAGIVSARNPEVGQAYDDFLQVNALINPGDAGGPLLNLRGEVVGINASTLRNLAGNSGIAFALSSDSAKRVISELETRGKVVRGWLGISVQSLTEDLASSLGLSELLGALVSEVNSGSPAADAGIKRGDLIVGFRGSDIRSPVELRRRVEVTDIGQRTEVRVLRAGKKQTMTVTVTEMPEPSEGPGSSNPSLLQVRATDTMTSTR